LSYAMPAHDPSFGPWAEISTAQRIVVAMAALFQARACSVLHPDLVALQDPASRLLASPVLDGKCDLVAPIYREGKYDGLINKSLLAPLSRALFGRRVRSPLAFDFCASARMLPYLADSGTQRGQPGSQLLWPGNIVAMEAGHVCQMYIQATHTTHTEGLDLSEVLGQLVGGLFQEVEACAAQWQRVRGSQPAEIIGPSVAANSGSDSVDAKPLDAQPLIDSFLLGSRNLEEVWRLVLPPVTLFDLKRLTRLAPAEFRMPDELWARIVYDFALAYRLRRIGRVHLLGALTPLYLGWVASYAQEVGVASTAEADQRVEQLAQVFEANKPYFVSRWRWPDRAN
jgi:glucosylglycerate synthase